MKDTDNNNKINKLGFMKIFKCCALKENTNRVKRKSTKSEKILANHISDKGIISKIHRELLKFNNKTNNLIQK